MGMLGVLLFANTRSWVELIYTLVMDWAVWFYRVYRAGHSLEYRRLTNKHRKKVIKRLLQGG